MPAWFALAAAFVLALIACAEASGDEAAARRAIGASVFAEKCADCHGEHGEGTDYYSIPLAGDLPVRELKRVIEDTMPEGDHEDCAGEEALAVAEHVHAAFYSPIAQARLRPPRRDLSRLTARQYQQSLADLMTELRWRGPWGDERGLKVIYETKRHAKRAKRIAERIEPTVNVSVAASDFLPDDVRSRQELDEETKKDHRRGRLDVEIRVSGGVLAPRTGDYDFIVESPNGFHLEVNGVRVIDARVRSVDDGPTRRAVVRLIGGRVYPLHASARRTEQDDLRFVLRWRTPGGAEEVIPPDALSPKPFPDVFVPSAPFPPDDRSVGYVRGASVSAAWDEASTDATLEFVKRVLSELPRHAKTKRDDGRHAAGDPVTTDEGRAFCERVAAIAFRRPLTDDERWEFVDAFFDRVADVDVDRDGGGGRGDDDPTASRRSTPDDALSVDEAVELALLRTLKSPRFLYQEVSVRLAPPAEQQQHAAATRLALGLWDSLPDRPLRNAADRGELARPGTTRWHAERMLSDRRTRAKLRGFFRHWLRLDHVSDLARDPEAFPDFDEGVAHSMLRSLEQLIDNVVWSGDGDLRELFLTDELFVDRRLAEFLELEFTGQHDYEFVLAPADNHERFGVVSHPYVVTALSYYRDTSPIHRGVFLARHVLGRSLRPPPEAVAPLAPELAPDMTTRERVATQTSPGACQACHVLINDLGFTLEHFDAVGRFRDRDVGKPIDPSGGYIATDGSEARFNGAADLARFLADSPDVHESFVTQLFSHVTKQPLGAYGDDTRERLLRSFRDSGYNVRDLLVDIAVESALAD